MSRQKQILLTLFFPILLFSLSQTCRAHNITKLLAQHPEFSLFNKYLTSTRLASEINRRLTITVLAVDNSAMSALEARHFTLQTMRHVLSLHILVDYYGSKKLHQLSRSSTLSSSLFQVHLLFCNFLYTLFTVLLLLLHYLILTVLQSK
jgi:Fasciclin domain